MPPELVSIMMPAYNAEQHICQAIDSALAQDYAFWELIVVNDGSRDRTPEIVASYADSRIRLFHQPNGGEASARNTALRHARGEYLAFLDADDLFLPEHLEACTAYLEARPDCDGVYTDGYYIDEAGRRLKPLSDRRRGPFQGDIFEEMVRASDVFGTPLCVVLRRQAIVKQQIDFDVEIVIGPDWDFLTRFAEKARFGYLDHRTCLYRVHASNISVSTGQQKRLQSLARCRQKSIKLERFGSCSVQTRTFAFYDLLVNLLTGNPERQTEITGWPEFSDLPAAERARLFRLMASRALQNGLDQRIIGDWLGASRHLNRTDPRAFLFGVLICLHPALCKSLLQLRYSSRWRLADASPFGDLVRSRDHLSDRRI